MLGWLWRGIARKGGERSLKGSDEDLKLVSVPTSLVREGEVVRVLPGEGIPRGWNYFGRFLFR